MNKRPHRWPWKAEAPVVDLPHCILRCVVAVSPYFRRERRRCDEPQDVEAGAAGEQRGEVGQEDDGPAVVDTM